MSIENILKQIWKRSPVCVRNLILSIMSSRIGTHDPKAPESPLYVLGAFASSSGLAEGARLYAAARRREGREVICLDITQAMRQRTDLKESLDGVVAFESRNMLSLLGTIVVHANPPQFQLVLLKLGSEFLRNKRIVAYWAWELETLPAVWVQALQYVDAVEAPSTFVQKAVQKYTDKPVFVLPHDVALPSKRKTDYMEDGILRCLFSFDISSGVNRKNPEAVLQAFLEAFPNGGAELTFKISGAKNAPEAMSEFEDLCSKVPHVYIVKAILTREELSELYCGHDVYLSLHRSEGYGLTIREALLHGLHVVATGWSGNMDFMEGELLAHPVPYRIVPICENVGPLKGHSGQWAEPDTHAAAQILIALKEQLVLSKSET